MVGGLIIFGMQASEQRTSLLTLQLIQQGKGSPSIRGKASMTKTKTYRNLALSPLESPVTSSSSASSDVESGSPQSDTGVRNMIEKEVEKIEAYSATKNQMLLDAGIEIPNGPTMTPVTPLAPILLKQQSNGFFNQEHLEKHMKDPGFAIRFKLLHTIFKPTLVGRSIKEVKKPVSCSRSSSSSDFEFLEDSEQESPDIFEFAE